MLRRFAPSLFSIVVVGLAATLLYTGPAKSADPVTLTNFGKSLKFINEQHPTLHADPTSGFITQNAQSAYLRTAPKAQSYRSLLVSGRWGGIDQRPDGPARSNWVSTVTDPLWKGVIVGCPPGAIGSGEVEPVGFPKFEYELKPQVKGEPSRVALRFWLAKDVNDIKPSWEFEVAAAVVTPMTAAALDGRLGLFTLTAATEKGQQLRAAIHPALEGHRLAYRLAILDLFAEVGGDEILKAELNVLPAEVKNIALGRIYASPSFQRRDEKERTHFKKKMNQPMRLNDSTVTRLALEQGNAENLDPRVRSLSAVVERPWELGENGLKPGWTKLGPAEASFKFVHRIVSNAKDEEMKYEELPISDRVNADVFASLTNTEKQLVREYDEAVIVHRIVYWANQGRIINFDRDQNWSRMINELGDIYKANLNKNINAYVLDDAANKWADDYTGKDRPMPEGMRFKEPSNQAVSKAPRSANNAEEDRVNVHKADSASRRILWKFILPFSALAATACLFYYYRVVKKPKVCRLCRGSQRRWVELTNGGGLVHLPCECASSTTRGAT